MKLACILSLSLACAASSCPAGSLQTSNDYKTIEEKIVFTVSFAPQGVSNTAPAPASFTMGRKDGSKMRDFYLAKNSDYAEMKNLTRQHITGNALIGGFFVDELISKDNQYVLILSGQVHQAESAGKKTYSKQGTWMDSLGRSGTWIDEVQQQSPMIPLAACGGK